MLLGLLLSTMSQMEQVLVIMLHFVSCRPLSAKKRWRIGRGGIDDTARINVKRYR